MCFFIFSFLNPSYLLLHQYEECPRSIERKQTRKRQNWGNKKKRKEKKLQRIRKEVFRTTKAIYIEPLASRPPPTFQKSSKNSREEKNIEGKILEALQHAPTMGEGLEKTLQGLQQHFSLLAPTIIVIIDSKEEDQLEKRTTKAKSDQLIEAKQSTNFLLELV